MYDTCVPTRAPPVTFVVLVAPSPPRCSPFIPLPLPLPLAAQIIDFTLKYPDPFSEDYPYANPWLTKKDNKGKKDAPKMQKI